MAFTYNCCLPLIRHTHHAIDPQKTPATNSAGASKVESDAGVMLMAAKIATNERIVSGLERARANADSKARRITVPQPTKGKLIAAL